MYLSTLYCSQLFVGLPGVSRPGKLKVDHVLESDVGRVVLCNRVVMPNKYCQDDTSSRFLPYTSFSKCWPIIYACHVRFRVKVKVT